MKKRQIGRSGLEVYPLTFGGNVFGWTVDEPTSFQLLDGFVGAGFNFIDTADMYSTWAPGNKGGESETIIGNWMKKRGNRKNVVIATKVAGEMGPDKKGLSKKYILRAVEDSLRRLQTDYIDLYQSHFDDTATPLAETLEAYTELIKQGKVRAIGASNYGAARLHEAMKISQTNGLARYESLQPLYNLYDRDMYENELAPVCREYGIGVINYYSLASGFLTGKYRTEKDLSQSQRGEGIKKRYMNSRGMLIIEALDRVAKEYGTTPTAVSLAWLLAHDTITAPIVSATNLKQLEEFKTAVSLSLKPSAIEILNQASES